MATNEDINIKVHSEGGERAIGITPEQTERSIGINNESIVVRSVKSYNDLDDKPQINSVELEGDKTASDLGFADVAMSGSYNDLTDTPEIPAAQVNADWNADSGVAEILNKPTIPTKTSQLDNDSGFLTSESDPVFSASAAATITSQDITDWNNKSDFSGSYNDLTDKPTIPTKTSQLTNDGADGTSTYVEADELSAVATSGSYSDLTNKPTIPTKTSDLTNDGADNTSVYVEADELATVATSGDYDDLINKPAAMTVDSALSWTSQNPVENQAIRKTIYVKNSSNDKEAGINIAFSDPTLTPYVHLGSKTSATKGINSVGIGNNAEASAVRSVAIGNSATASKREGVALGPNATAGQYSLSIGYYTETVPNYSTAVGPYAKVLTGATNATAIGYQSEASEAETVSVGKSTKKRRIVNVADGTTATDAATVGQIPTKTSDLTNDGADNTSTYVEADELATVATSGLYSDLTGTPTIPTVNNATLTIQRNGTNVQTFTANASSNVTANISVPTKTSDLTNDGSDNTAQYLETDETAYKTASIPYGECDSTSTSTAFTATVPGITELRDGVCMLLKNGVVTSASGFTININGLGAKPAYSNMSAATRESTAFNINYTIMFVYDSDRVEGGCWVYYRGYYSDANSIGYQLRTNSTALTTTDRTKYYRLLFTSADNTQWVPANTQYDNSATSNKTINQRKINPFGRIVYLGNSTNYSEGAAVTATAVWDQYAFNLGYSFAKGSALTMTFPKPVYIKCAPQTDGSAIIDSTTPYVQDLPSTEDGKIYIYLGMAYSATNVEMVINHPIYYYKDGAIREWSNAPAAIASVAWGDITGTLSNQTDLNTALGAKANSADLATVATSGSYNDLSNRPTIPAAQVNSDWSANSGVAQILNKPTLATVATSGSYNDLTDKPTIPTVNNATLTIQKNGTSVGTFTANASANVTANITVPTQTSDLTNNSGFLTSSTAVTSFNGSTGAITYTAPVTSVNGSTGAITGLQTTSNLVTSVSGSSTDSQYPSAKLFYDTIGNVETILNTLNNGGGAQ